MGYRMPAIHEGRSVLQFMMTYKWIGSNGVRFNHYLQIFLLFNNWQISHFISPDDIISVIIENGLVGLVNVTPMRRSCYQWCTG